MWKINSFDVLQLRTGTGERLTALVDDLIRSECLLARIPFQAIRTNLRTNLADGGVDTQVSEGGFDRTGWLKEPTAWQYKATEFAGLSSVDRKSEISKPYVVACIRKGHGYRFVIADELPPNKKSEWEQEFDVGPKRLSRPARPVSVLSA